MTTSERCRPECGAKGARSGMHTFHDGSMRQ